MIKLELEISKNTNKEWVVSLGGVTIGTHHFELAARHTVDKIKRANPSIEFDEIG